MAAAAQTNRREQVEFPPNVAVTLSLAYAAPKRFTGTNGNLRCMFTTTDNRVAFLDAEVAGRITELGINVRESFTITRKSSGKRGDSDTWEVARTIGEQPNGTMVVPAIPDAIVPKASQRASCPTGGAALVEEAKALVAVHAEVLDWALTTFQGRVKPEEVRALVVTAYIQRRQLSSVA